jgi:alpha-tubulin suppressor-like RCC1 family protein
MLARFVPYRSYGHEIIKRKLYSQGCGVFGALGQGDSLLDSTDFRAVPVLDTSQESASSSAISMTRVSAGWGHSAALSADGGLYIFGRPYDFSTLLQINRIRGVSSAIARHVGRFTSAFGKESDGLYCAPIRIEALESVASIHCGAGLTLCRTISGEVFSFGQNRWGQCGIGDDKKVHVYQPVRVKLPVMTSAVDSGLQHCIAVSEKGSEVYCWGKGNRGQLGNVSFEGSTVPVLVRNIKGLVVSVSAGFNHSAALTNDGDVYVWGKGMSDKLKSDTIRGNDIIHTAYKTCVRS